MLDADDIKKIFEVLDPHFTKIYNKLLEHDQRFEKIDARLDKLEKDVAEIKGYHKDLEKTLETIKRLFTEITFKVTSLEDRVFDLENNPETAQKEYAATIKQEFEALKDRITRLEKLVDRVCEAENKYKS